MTDSLSLNKKISLYLVKFLIAIIWFVDVLGNYPFRASKTLSRVLIVILISSVFVPFSAPNKLATNLVQDAGYIPIYLDQTFNGQPRFELKTNVLGASSSKVSEPLLVNNISAPKLSAISAYAVDIKSGKTLFEHNANESLAPASTTKLMTALVALDLYDLDEKVSVPQFCTTVESSRAGLIEGEEFTVDELLHLLLIASAGDAACTLATNKVSYDEFISRMNEKAISIGMNETSFTNPVGLDGVNFSHFSTAADLYLLGKAAISNPIIKDIVSVKEYEFGGFTIYNTNKLLWEVPNTVGIKTGTTEAAGEVLIYEMQDELKDLMIVIMKSQNRFADTKLLLDWLNNSYTFFPSE